MSIKDWSTRVSSGIQSWWPIVTAILVAMFILGAQFQSVQAGVSENTIINAKQEVRIEKLESTLQTTIQEIRERLIRIEEKQKK